MPPTDVSNPAVMRDWSIDLETLDNKPTSAILSIGAVLFDRESGKIGCRHYQEIAVDSAIAHGTVSGSTLSWWVQQGEKAKRVFGTGTKAPLDIALNTLAMQMRRTPGPRVWGNGSSFDISILEHAFARAGGGIDLPWKHWDIRDMRTTVDDADLDIKRLPRIGTHHNALDDAEFQAVAISLARRRIRAALGLTLPPWQGPAGYEGAPAPMKSTKGSPVTTAPTTPVDDDEEL